jgi:hypothetical protein
MPVPTPPADATMPINTAFAAGTQFPPVSQADQTMPISTAMPGSDRAMPFRNDEPESDRTMPISTAAAQAAAAGTPFGVGASGGSRQPFGQPPAPAGGPGTYGSGSGHTSVPQQREQGGTYGGLADYAPGDMTMPISMNAVENSGSLTGHILAQGWRDVPEVQRRSNVKVVVAMLLVLGFLVGVSLLFVFTVGDAFSNMIGGVFSG